MLRINLNATRCWKFPKRVQVVEDSTLRTIRAFTQSEVDSEGMMIEDRILEVHETELRRPVRYFWSVNDFVLGLRGAVLGHLYLLKIHILHRDVSENNVVLACIPGQPRGCLVDFDMAVRYEARERPTSNAKLVFQKRPNNSASQESHKGPFKAERTGTIPYMGPLLMSDLDAGGKCGFRQVLGSGRAQNVCDWPAIFKPWSESMSAVRGSFVEIHEFNC
ncbi:hypothetical protein F5I97DRAFT_1107050 [Phlebopus sp. FC_14]|nr:hypothetical protein F5I97DRAFT_1107050 [Phlebopus sp. FC_14]